MPVIDQNADSAKLMTTHLTGSNARPFQHKQRRRFLQHQLLHLQRRPRHQHLRQRHRNLQFQLLHHQALQSLNQRLPYHRRLRLLLQHHQNRQQRLLQQRRLQQLLILTIVKDVEPMIQGAGQHKTHMAV